MKLHLESSVRNDFTNCFTEYVPCTENCMTEKDFLWVMITHADLQKRSLKTKINAIYILNLIMTNEIKEYKELTVISTFDWDILVEADIETMERAVNSQWNFIRIWDEIIAKNQIKKIWKRTVDTIENFILQFPREIQQKLRERDKEKYDRVWKHFESIQEIQNYMKDKNIL